VKQIDDVAELLSHLNPGHIDGGRSRYHTRHCERSETDCHRGGTLDCFVV